MPPRARNLYFNENEPFTAAWLRRLYPYAEIDQRGIEDITGEEVRRYRRVHLFGGIGGWEYALHLSGWQAVIPVWTGSCPCQPFSLAGSHRGFTDKRNLWPHMLRLVRECLPSTIFGEQVASPAGRKWLSRVFTDLEELGYAVAGADLCAAGVGAPHIRQRLFWVARRMGHPDQTRLQRHWPKRELVQSPGRLQTGRSSFWNNCYIVTCRDGKHRRTEPGVFPLAYGISNRVGRLCGYGNAIVPQVAAVFIRAFTEVINEDQPHARTV